MSKVMYRSDDSYVSCRAGVYYYIRRVPYDVRQHYASKRLSFSLKTKSNASALRATQSVTQRLQDIVIPAIHLVKTNHEDDSPPVMLDIIENYLHIKCINDRICVRTTQRKGNCVAKLLAFHSGQLDRLMQLVTAPPYFHDIVMRKSATPTQLVLR